MKKRVGVSVTTYLSNIHTYLPTYIQVAGKGQTWVSVGVISGKVQMVTNPFHQTMLYPNAEGKAVMMELKAQRAEGVVPVDFDPKVGG